MRFLKLFVLTLLIATPLSLLNGCGAGSDTPTGSQSVASANGTANLVGIWSVCYYDEGEGIDIEMSLTFTETTYSMDGTGYLSTSGNCDGLKLASQNMESGTYTPDDTKAINAWSDETNEVGAPAAAVGGTLPATPTVSMAQVNSGGGDSPLLAYIDDTGAVDRIYFDASAPTPPCGFGDSPVDGYPNCLSTDMVLERQ